MRRLSARYNDETKDTTMKNSSDAVYLNVTFSNPTPYESDGVTPRPDPFIARYNKTKTEPIVGKANDYYLTPLRFDLPLTEVPLFIYPVKPNQPATTGQESTCLIGIEYGGIDYDSSLRFDEQGVLAPQENNPAPISYAPIVNQNKMAEQIVTDYYYVFSYQYMITSINNALIRAFNASGVGTVMSGLGGVEIIPRLYYSEAESRIHLVVTEAFMQTGAEIYFNEALFRFLDGFPLRALGYRGVNPQKNYFFRLIRNYQKYNTYVAPPGVPSGIGIGGYYDNITAPIPINTYWDYEQEYFANYLWFSLKRLVIVSGSIPIVSENIPVFQGIDGTGIVQTGEFSNLPIISDFVPIIESAKDPRSIAYFLPSAQYKLIDMKASTGITKIDIQVYWEDTLGRLFPLYLPSTQTGSIKFGFIKKTLANNDIERL